MKLNSLMRKCLVVVLTLSPLVIGGACSDEPAPVSAVPADTTPSFSASDFSSAEDCKLCHQQQYDEWSGSMHAFAAKDPVFTALNKLGQSAYVNAVDQGCVKCHTVIGSRAGETPWGEFDVNSLSPVAQEGVTCDVCHTITSINAIQNSEINLTPGNTRFGSIENPTPNDAHESEYHPLYASSAYCGSCHDIITDDGLGLETTFREWENGGFAMTGKTCNGCHMPEYTGQAAPGSPTRTLHRHTFVGADLALIDFPKKAEQFQLVTQLLQSAVTMGLSAPSMTGAGALCSLNVTITNDKTGHDVPTGASFLREVWLEVIVKDNSGNILYSSGQLDANGDLMTEDSEYPARDVDLTSFHATMYRSDSIKTTLPWAVSYLVNPSIKAGQTKSATYYFTVPAVVTGPLSADVRLRYRSFPPYVFRSIDLDSLLPLPIIDMAQQSRSITIP